MKLTIVIPTIDGREESLATVIAAYRKHVPKGLRPQIVTPLNESCWPAGCNAGFAKAKGDIIHFGADDLEPLEGWYEAALAELEAGFVPAPQIWDYVHSDSRPVNEAADGPPGTVTTFSRVPTLTREMAEAIGPWPIMDYYADNWVSDKARVLGWETRVAGGYRFVHHWHPVGRLDAGDWVGRSLPRYNEERAKLGLGPIGR